MKVAPRSRVLPSAPREQGDSATDGSHTPCKGVGVGSAKGGAFEVRPGRKPGYHESWQAPRPIGKLKSELISPGVYGPRFVEDWRLRSACKGMDQDIFLGPDEPETTSQRNERIDSAKAVCGGCSVRVECLDWANAANERYGVWGGLTPSERRRLHVVPAPESEVKRCINGHPQTVANRYIRPNGSPDCRACKRERTRKKRRKA